MNKLFKLFSTGVVSSVLLLVAGFLFSCQQAPWSDYSRLTSIDDRDDYDDEDDDDDDDRRTNRVCDDRDSCSDSCDYMFVASRARSKCYDLSMSDVNNLEEVFDVLSSNSISDNDLEDVDEDDLEEFLGLSVDGWVDVIKGDRDDGQNEVREAYSSNDARKILEWIADNDDIANVILANDDDADVFYELFLRLGTGFDIGTKRLRAKVSTTPTTYVQWSNSNSLQIGSPSIASTSPSISLTGVDNFIDFILGFIGLKGASNDLYFEDESYIRYARNNSSALESAQNSLRRFCADAAGKDEEDDETKQCMMAVYCTIRSIEDSSSISGTSTLVVNPATLTQGIFSILDDESSIFGRADTQGCEYKHLADQQGGKIDRYF